LEDELKLVFEAERKAKDLISAALTDAERAKAEARKEAEAMVLDAKAEAQSRGEEMVSRKLAEAEAKGNELRLQQDAELARMERVAASRMEQAVEMILRSIIEES
jgi:vacuolar-type H+-ATPase subunit H